MTMPSSAERFDRTGTHDTLRTSTDDAARQAGSSMRDMADQVSDRASDYAEEARRKAGEVAESARAYGREAQHAVGDVAGNFREALERSIERQPMTTVLLAMAAGVVIGGILRR